MACDHNWTIKFPNVNDGDPFEIRPVEMSLKMSRHEYDFCRAKFPFEVGEMMKPHTRYEGGALYGLRKVDVCYNGNPIQPLVFRPDWADYGSQFTHLQFHDLHKALGSGTIDTQKSSVQLEAIYEEVVNSANNRIIDEVVFTYPEEQTQTLYGSASRGGEFGAMERRRQEQNDVGKTINAKYAVDFENESPEKALRILNKKFRLKSWVNRNGVLVVGLPEANSIRHIAAPDDDRVWRYKDPNISHGREPILRAIVEGAWVDDPGFELNPLDWFDKGGTKDFIAMGIAERDDINYGKEFIVKSSKAKRDALPHVATLALKERMKQQNAGTIEIDPALSGTEISEPLDLSPGDLLHLVPEDDYFNNPTASSGEIGDGPDDPDKVCGGFVNNEAYLVSEVEHSVTDTGEWQMFADVGMYPDIPISSHMDYFNPEKDKWVDNSQIAEDGSLEDAIFEDF